MWTNPWGDTKEFTFLINDDDPFWEQEIPEWMDRWVWDMIQEHAAYQGNAKPKLRRRFPVALIARWASGHTTEVTLDAVEVAKYDPVYRVIGPERGDADE